MSEGETLIAAKSTARSAALRWFVGQLPLAAIVLVAAVGLLILLKRSAPVVLGGAGLAISTLASYWLAASLFPKDDEVRAMDTIAGLDRSPAALRERAKAQLASVALLVGFVLQFVALAAFSSAGEQTAATAVTAQVSPFTNTEPRPTLGVAPGSFTNTGSRQNPP